MRTRRLPFAVIGAVLLVGLVGLLAVLQYRWLGQVSQAEREQLRRSLEIRGHEFADEFDAEIGALYLSLTLSRDALDRSDWSAFADRVDRWRSGARHPQLVRAVYLVETSRGSGQTLRPYDPAARGFGSPTADWPPHLVALRDRIAAVPPVPLPTPPANAARIIATTFLPVAPDVPALVIPIWRHTVSTTGLSSFTLDRADAVIVAELDGEYIRGSLVPALVARHFPAREADSYRVAVLSGSDSVVFSRGFPPTGVDPARADLVTPFFTVRLDAVRDILPGGANASSAPSADRLAVIVQHRESTATVQAAGAAGTQIRLVRPGWRLVLAHATGSLDAAVERARRRNLWLAFGLLGVLAAGVVMVVRNGRRAARLATQQMDFVATVSHELRTPLAVIRSAAQNLSAGVVSEPGRAKRYGELIEEEGRRLTDMVEQVLEYARLTGAPAASPREPLDVAELAAAVAESCRPLCEEGGVTLDVSVERHAGTVVLGDEAGLRRALHNLITNALKHGADGGWVGVAVERVNGKGRPQLRITVRDRGQGIDAADIGHVFEPFFRGRRAAAEQVRGNGLGLGLVKRVVEAHGGRIAVESAPGKGAVFTVHLPAVEEAQPPS